MRTLILAIGLGVILVTTSCSAPEGEQTPPPATYQTRSNEGDISFHLTPRPWASGRLILDVRADTHSGDLADVKLRDVVTLQVGNQVYSPVEATPLAGHHAEGSITFDVAQTPNRFTVTIKGVRSMGELRFEWP